jgi:PAS domain S-box-containing protein
VSQLALTDVVPCAVWTARPDGWVDYANQFWLRYTGMTLDETYGWGWAQALHPSDRPRATDIWERALQTGVPVDVEYRVRRADGAYRWFLARGVPVRDELGNVARWYGTLTDIDEQKRLEEERALLLVREQVAHVELERAKRAAEAANRAKSEFLSRMSHELRTPLNAILGFGQLLEMGTPTPQQRQHIEQILKGGRHLLAVINEVLDLARSEAGRLKLSLEPLALRHVCAEVCDLVRPLAQRHAIRVEPPCAAGEAVHVLADNQRLKQVLLNLLANAVKYNHAQGEVRLTWEELPEGWVRLAVRDTGPGIAPEKLQRLFNPFDRLGAEASAVEGTGLGLVVSKRLTEAMGGRLDLTSTVGQGTTVLVDLPLWKDEGASMKDESRTGSSFILPPASLPGGTVLYIEDNRANLRLMEDILAYRPAVRLLTAVQGDAGLELARQHQPDAILLDAHLPDMPGEEVVRQVRSDARLHSTPVVIISADATAPQIERCRAAGASEYLTKPIDVARLLTLLDRFTRERHVHP